MLDLLNLGEPEFINDEGFRWYRTEIFKRRAVGVGVSVFTVCDKDDNPQAHVAIDNKSNNVVHEDSAIEGMAVYLDKLTLSKQHNNAQSGED